MMPLGSVDTEVGTGPGDIVLGGDRASPMERGIQIHQTVWPQYTHFLAMSVVAKLSYC